MQDNPLAIVSYGLGVLLLIKKLKGAHPGVTHPWYADDAGALGTFLNIEDYFNSLTHPDNLKAGISFGKRHGFKAFTCVHYLGGFIWDNTSKREWLIVRKAVKNKNISTISKIAVKYPQESYAAIAHEIQSEWILLQKVMEYTVFELAIVEIILHKTFLPQIFSRKTNPPPLTIGTLSMMPVKKSGIGFQNMMTLAHK